jgi:hypothetical protein
VVHQNLQVTTLSDIAEASGRRITAEAYPWSTVIGTQPSDGPTGLGPSLVASILHSILHQQCIQVS